MTICHGKGAQWGGRGSDPLQQCLMRIKNTTEGCPNGSIPYAGGTYLLPPMSGLRSTTSPNASALC